MWKRLYSGSGNGNVECTVHFEARVGTRIMDVRTQARYPSKVDGPASMLAAHDCLSCLIAMPFAFGRLNLQCHQEGEAGRSICCS